MEDFSQYSDEALLQVVIMITHMIATYRERGLWDKADTKRAERAVAEEEILIRMKGTR